MDDTEKLQYDAKITTEFLKESAKQEQLPNQIYKHEPIAEIEPEFYYTTTEYLTPTGQRGYQVIYLLVKDKDRYTKSKGVGIEELARTWDWELAETKEYVI
jgi:hypothetical protein